MNAVELVRIQDIEANPNQPRRVFDEAGLKELADSILAHGIIQPITLRKIRAEIPNHFWGASLPGFPRGGADRAACLRP